MKIEKFIEQVRISLPSSNLHNNRLARLSLNNLERVRRLWYGNPVAKTNESILCSRSPQWQSYLLSAYVDNAKY